MAAIANNTTMYSDFISKLWVGWVWMLVFCLIVVVVVGNVVVVVVMGVHLQSIQFHDPGPHVSIKVSHSSPFSFIIFPQIDGGIVEAVVDVVSVVVVDVSSLPGAGPII